MGGIQPEILPDVFKAKDFANGLLPRFMPLCLGNAPIKFSKQGLAQSEEKYWDEIVRGCYNIPLKTGRDGYVNPLLMRFDDEALNVFSEYHDWINDLAKHLSKKMGAYVPKLITYQLKYSAILHCLRAVETGQTISNRISRDTVEKAILLTGFFAGQVAKMIDLYESWKPRLNEHEQQLIRTLFELRPEVQGGWLALQRITAVFNFQTPQELRFTERKISARLKKLGLETRPGAHNLRGLVWEEKKLQQLFTMAKLTTLTTLTQESSLDDEQSTSECVRDKNLHDPTLQDGRTKTFIILGEHSNEFEEEAANIVEQAGCSRPYAEETAFASIIMRHSLKPPKYWAGQSVRCPNGDISSTKPDTITGTILRPEGGFDYFLSEQQTPIPEENIWSDIEFKQQEPLPEKEGAEA